MTLVPCSIQPRGFERIVLMMIFALSLAAFATLPAAAQQGFADSMSGFSANSNEPISIEADSLEVRDGDKVATFIGNVIVTQGETVMQTAKLKVFYSGSAQGAGDQDIERLETEGRVVVTSGDQKASGDLGVFDAAKDTITLSGNVVLSQGENVIQGDTLFVDLAAGTSYVLSESSQERGRVRGLFTPNRDQPQPAPAEQATQ